MTTDDRLPNLMLLLSLAPLAAGCPGGDDTSDSTTVNPPTTGPSTSTDGSTGPGPATTTGMDGTTTTGMDGTTTTGTDPDTTAGDSTTGGLVCGEPPPVNEIHPACVAYNEQFSECYYDGAWPQECIDYYSAYCQLSLDEAEMAYGEMCSTAYIDLYSCLTMLSCEELQMAKDPCPDQFMALEMACAK